MSVVVIDDSIETVIIDEIAAAQNDPVVLMVADASIETVIVEEITMVVQQDEQIVVLTVGTQGPAGTGDAHYQHDQLAPSATWTINHTLDKYPSVSIVDSAQNIVIGEVQYLSRTQLRVTFTAAFGGIAYLN